MIEYDVSGVSNQEFLELWKFRKTGEDKVLSAFEMIKLELGDPEVRFDLIRFLHGTIDFGEVSVLHSIFIVNSDESYVKKLYLNEEDQENTTEVVIITIPQLRSAIGGMDYSVGIKQ